MRLTRRSFFVGSAGGAAFPWITRAQPVNRPARTRLILLGTAGGPTPKRQRAAPAQVILAGDRAYVVDCGNGVARQLVSAGVPLGSLRHIFITHHHSDHNADYGTLLLLAWAGGLRSRVDSWGPPPMARITKLFLEMSAPDLQVREIDEGRPPLAPLVHPHELTAGGPVMQDERLKVRYAAVNHPRVTLALAFRFDGPDRSIVISGDTTRAESLIALARGADVLVHEALYLPAVKMIAGSDSGAANLEEHLLQSHTPVEEAGKIAAEAGVKTLVLSHLVPAETPPVPDEVWVAGAKKHFNGTVVVGRDLMEI